MDKNNTNPVDFDLSNKPKTQQEEILSKVQLKSIEKDCLERVFNRLCELQEELSSDDNSKEKKYLNEISKNANAKKMKKDFLINTTYKSTGFKVEKKFKEDDPKANSLNSKISNNTEEPKKRIGKKSIRKIIRQLNEEISPEEIQFMIWEVDENLDGYVNEQEFEKMYKRCIIDQKEQEPKRLFYLVQFLIYDKENKGFITEEDTLEILYIRYEDKFTSAIEDIFTLENKNILDKNGQPVKERRESMKYMEFAGQMNFLSSQKRKFLSDKKKNYCGEVLKKLRNDLNK